ncbi:BTB/POZ protein [Phyllosticta capitalensis]
MANPLGTDDEPHSHEFLTEAQRIQLEIPGKIVAIDQEEHAFVTRRFRHQMNKYYRTGQFTDLMLRFSDGQRLHVHKALVFAYSDVFEKACSGPFVESRTRTIEISHEDSEAVNSMIHWMYTGSQAAPGGQSPLLFHIRLYAVANYYQVQLLQREMKQRVQVDVKEQLTNNGTELPAAIELIYSCTPDSDKRLRDAVVLFCARYYKRCANSPIFKEIEEPGFWRALCQAREMFRDSAVIQSFDEYQCEDCGLASLTRKDDRREDEPLGCCTRCDMRVVPVSLKSGVIKKELLEEPPEHLIRLRGRNSELDAIERFEAGAEFVDTMGPDWICWLCGKK